MPLYLNQMLSKPDIAYLQALQRQERKDLLSPCPVGKDGQYDLVDYVQFFAKIFDQPVKRFG